ncbi:Protein of unknown function [Cotesia congregata]|uniref:Uncharacterized protein n=1 Tax=Cotesia congregata TaxID=51543 RepID=A0A8J2HRH0_COTCN|nr:Protein of unknown function [Cotesia congregata]
MSKQSSYLDQKGTHDVPRYRSKSKKRKFTGNQHTFEQSTANTSTSAEKLLHNNDENIVIDPSHGYCILQFVSVFSAISNLVMCKTCHKEITFNQASPRGLGFKIAVICECEKDLTSKEEKSETNLTISGDSTWKKRGLTSRFGIVTLAGKYSKEILDSCVKSTYCQSCIFNVMGIKVGPAACL